MHKKLHADLDYKLFLGVKLARCTTCIGHQKVELKDIHEKFGGFPKTYVKENTMIDQKWWDKNECDYDDLGKKLGMEVVTVSTIMQPPGQIIPWHRDTFFQIKKRFPDDKRMKVRANMYLEDWKMGQFLQYDNTVDVKWKAGDGHMWDSEVLHLGANAGMENKYTLQVSGFLNDTGKN
jgi:hypothetical protein